MSLSKYVKSIGLPSVTVMSAICDVERSVLNRWWKDNPKRLKCMARGCVSIQNDEDFKGIIDIKDCLLEIKKLLEEKR